MQVKTHLYMCTKKKNLNVYFSQTAKMKRNLTEMKNICKGPKYTYAELCITEKT
jgi:hypothetical protein